MDKEKLRAAIDEIPGDKGWWRSSTGETFWVVAQQLLDTGIAPNAIVELLSSLYWATASEFGA